MDLVDHRTKVGGIVYLRGYTSVPMVVTKIEYSSNTYYVAWLDKEERPCSAFYLIDCLYAEHNY